MISPCHWLLRMRETMVCNAVLAPVGASTPHASSIKAAALTGRPRERASANTRAFARGPGKAVEPSVTPPNKCRSSPGALAEFTSLMLPAE